MWVGQICKFTGEDFLFRIQRQSFSEGEQIFFRIYAVVCEMGYHALDGFASCRIGDGFLDRAAFGGFAEFPRDITDVCESRGDVSVRSGVAIFDFRRVAGVHEGLHVGFRSFESFDFLAVFVEGGAPGSVATGEISTFALDDITDFLSSVVISWKAADFKEDGDGVVEVADLGVGPIAIVIVAEAGTDGDDGGREYGIADEPAADIELVGALVAKVAVTVGLLPVPIVMEFFAGNGDHFAWAAPEIVVYGFRWLGGSFDFSDAGSWLVAKSPREGDFSEFAGFQEIVSFMPCSF